MPVTALEPEAAAVLLAAAGVRRGDTVLVAGGDGLLERAAAAATGPDGRVVDPRGLAFAAAPRVARVLATALDRRPDAAALTGTLGPGGRLAVAVREADADALAAALTGRGWSLRHRSRVPHGVEVLALVAPAGDRAAGA